MPEIPSQDYKSFQSGRIAEEAVSEHKMPDDAVSESINFHFDRIGAATLRRGTTLLGSQISAAASIRGLHQFIDANGGANSRIMAVIGTTLKYLNGSNVWTNILTGLTSDKKTRFTDFLDFTWMVNGVDATKIWDGDTAGGFVDTGNAAGAPIGKFIDRFRARVLIAGDPTYPSRLHYSSLPSAATTPVISWNTNVAGGQWIDIDPSDGGDITAIKSTKNVELIFKQNTMYRMYSISQLDPDPFASVGTYSQESVVKAEDGNVYFHHPSGFHYYAGGEVKNISKPIIDVVKAISVSNWEHITGWSEPQTGSVCWSIGDITLRGVSIPNAVVRYTASSEVWTLYSYPTQFTAATSYKTASALYSLAGDDDGNVLLLNTGSTDNGTEIFYHLVEHWRKVDNMLSTHKSIPKILVAHEGGTGTNVKYQVGGDDRLDWSKGLGQLRKCDTILANAMIEGHKYRLAYSGTSKGEEFTLNGHEVLESRIDVQDRK